MSFFFEFQSVSIEAGMRFEHIPHNHSVDLCIAWHRTIFSCSCISTLNPCCLAASIVCAHPGKTQGGGGNLTSYFTWTCQIFVTQHSSMNFAFQSFDTSTILQAESGPECNAPRCDKHCSCSQVECTERQKVFEDVLNVSLQTTSNLLTCIQLKGPVSQPCWWEPCLPP